MAVIVTGRMSCYALLLPADTDLSRSNQEELSAVSIYTQTLPLGTFSYLYPHSDLKSDPTGAAKVLFEARYALTPLFRTQIKNIQLRTSEDFHVRCWCSERHPSQSIIRHMRIRAAGPAISNRTRGTGSEGR
jgi:hypothetical protein